MAGDLLSPLIFLGLIGAFVYTLLKNPSWAFACPHQHSTTYIIWHNHHTQFPKLPKSKSPK
jgi:hypothetical protein